MYVLRLHRLGQTMEEGALVAWLQPDNKPFIAGDEIFEVATEKASMVVEATRPGRIVRRLAEVGNVMKVGAALAVIAEGDEVLSDDEISSATATPQSAPLEASEDQGESPETPSPVVAPKPGRTAAVPAARRLAVELGMNLEAISGSGPDGTITVADVQRASDGGRPA